MCDLKRKIRLNTKKITDCIGYVYVKLLSYQYNTFFINEKLKVKNTDNYLARQMNMWYKGQ